MQLNHLVQQKEGRALQTPERAARREDSREKASGAARGQQEQREGQEREKTAERKRQELREKAAGAAREGISERSR
jgi:hypothetical protein